MPSSHRDKSDRRPTLPPIRDLFRDELAQHPNNGHEPPQAILARLRVYDESDLGRNSPRPLESFSRHRGDSTSRGNPEARPNFSSSHGGYTRRTNHSSGDTPSSRQGILPSSFDYDQLPLQRSMSHHQLDSRAHEHPRYPIYDDARIITPSTLPPRDSREEAHSHAPRYSHTPTYPPPKGQTVGVLRPSPWPISTRMDKDYGTDDEDRTPVARYPAGVPLQHPRQPGSVDEPLAAVSSSKYECQYCGKGFNRPSSLKIHLNSHTGEKPFVCPVNGCGRSFSVLSNMRRHARVHTQPSGKEKEGSSDASDEQSVDQSDDYRYGGGDPKWHQRRASIASTSSSASRRSRSESSDEEEEDPERPEKRSRRLT